MDFRTYLKVMVEKDASDIYMSRGAPVSAKIHGLLTPLEEEKQTRDQIKAIAYSIMDAEQIGDFEKKPEMNLAISEEGIGRFRVNIFRQRNSISMVIRKHLDFDVPRRLQELFHINDFVAECRASFRLGHGDCCNQGCFGVNHAHTAAAATAGCLDDDRITDLAANPEILFRIIAKRSV